MTLPDEFWEDELDEYFPEPRTSLDEIVDQIDPSRLTYTEWIQVGMALKACGNPLSDWEAFSQRDPARYHPGECAKKWESFQGSGISSGTIVHIAESQGIEVDTGFSFSKEAFDWDTVFDASFFSNGKDTHKDEEVIVDHSWVERKSIEVPDDRTWDAVGEIITYIQTLFQADEYVGYVMESWEKDGKYMPSKGVYTRTSSDILKELTRSRDISSALGDYNPLAGAWIRFNALDGQGVRNDNVSEFRYALVESDNLDKGLQWALMEQLELPIATLVDSGNKSLHAIVKVDAANYAEYKRRVDYLYDVCKKNGLTLDVQNKNPSRLSRLPGVVRNGHKQFLVATNIGRESWNEWVEFIQAVNDDLPDPEPLSSVWDNMPELADPLIDGVLRKGHKMLLSGPSKAGKSFALIELCIAIAEGKHWMGKACSQGRVLYVNLELDRASALHRFKDVYTALKLPARNIANIDIWNLRGKSVPMDKLAPKLIRRAHQKNYTAVVIDPIYKVITGDENSADQMSAFCNQFDRVADALSCAVIYCHHHSKGAQGAKRAIDRASGSGVFARDPDAILDMVELEVPEEVLSSTIERLLLVHAYRWLDAYDNTWRSRISERETRGLYTLMAWGKLTLSEDAYARFTEEVDARREALKAITAWRIEGTLREFPKFEDVNIWFDFPTHLLDWEGALAEARVLGEFVDLFSEKGERLREKGREKATEKAHEKQAEKVIALRNAIEACQCEGLAPTRANVLHMLNHCEMLNYEVSAGQLRSWTEKRATWSPFRVNPKTRELYEIQQEESSEDFE